MTPTEHLLWDRVRDRRLNGMKFRRQHAIGRFVIDFFCAEARLAVEIDGEIHDDPEQQARDRERQGLIEEQAIRFIRFSNRMIEQDIDAVCGEIVSFARMVSPSPAESGEGARG